MEKRTSVELAALKAKWLEEPYWVIEDTEGFEAHRDELRQFRHDAHAKQEQEKQARLIKLINQYQPEKLNMLTEAREPGEPQSKAKSREG
ncbi:MAG: hypothetical protein WCA45_09855 [Thiobacillaceae bacterium]